MHSKISVVVPVYNVVGCLRRCVSSILNQDYQNIEVILIDDGSQDNSGALCDELKKTDQRIQVLHKENEGLGITRNRGINVASGKYITFVDSDDYIPTNALSLMAKKMEDSNADLVIGNFYYGNTIKNTTFSEGLYSEQDITNQVMVHMLGNFPKKEDMVSVSAWGKLYNLELIKKNQLHFPSEREWIWEDVMFNTELLPCCRRVYVLCDPVYYYCFNESSLTHKYNPRKLELILKMYEHLNKVVEKNKLKAEAKLRLDNSYLGHVRTCLKLEVYYSKRNGKKQARTNVRKICDNKTVQELIERFPEQYYSLVQKVYSKAIASRNYSLVYLLTWLQLKYKRID